MTTDKPGSTTRNGWKTCARGHKYRGPGPCPKCWPGGARRKDAPAAKKPTAKKPAAKAGG